MKSEYPKFMINENNNIKSTSSCPNLRRLVPKLIAMLPKRLIKAPITHSPIETKTIYAKEVFLKYTTATTTEIGL